MAEVKTQEFMSASKEALGNAQIQKALRGVSGFDQGRRECIEELTPEVWEELRERGRQIKTNAIANLDTYIAMLEERVTANGGHVHFAKDAEEANAIVVDIAKQHGVKLVVKSKSMASEETRVNDALAREGIRAVETDLGEYIVQLADETPFHIVAPAIHKTREDVAELFAEKINRPGLVEIEDMAAAARDELRQEFIRADMGISGANFLVAETGTLVIITNEGNGRLCTSAPRVHVALAGMEKVVPSLEDLAVLLRLLPRSATGQRLTSYVSMVSGPKADEDVDGPEEFHLVLMDNGRTRLLADPVLREVLNCLRCGACLNICPVYQKVGGHAYGWVYPGPIGAIITPTLVGEKQAKELPFASTLCGACRDACPVKIDIPRLLLHQRRKISEGIDGKPAMSGRKDRLFAWAFHFTMSHLSVLGLARRVGLLAQLPFIRKGVVSKVPLSPISRWTKGRDLPRLPGKSFKQRWGQGMSKGSRR